MRDRAAVDRKKSAMKQVAAVESILRRWDPIGVFPELGGPADEYDSYAPHIVSMVARGCSLQELVSHLHQVRTITMGVEEDPVRDMEVASEILRSVGKRAV